MKQIKFEKVVEGDKEYLNFAWFFGLASLIIPFFLFIDKADFLGIVFTAFFNGASFLAFLISILKYEDSRKVYWRKMK
ncbi:hypothetical protein LCGC14_0477920 [marine sediment metagenome]|uniref:Uncharacterized protein n=1 Tax=marine sediment metagenome TaxID=412755 RepID=A0A0F9UXE8_9ZZZZ